MQKSTRNTNADTISAEDTVLDILHGHPETQAVFAAHDAAAGECICCAALFETVATVAERYGLDLEALLGALRAAAGGEA